MTEPISRDSINDNDSDDGFDDSSSVGNIMFDDDDLYDNDDAFNQLNSQIDILDDGTTRLDTTLNDHLREDANFFSYIQTELNAIYGAITATRANKDAADARFAELTDELELNQQKIQYMTDEFNAKLHQLYAKFVADLHKIEDTIQQLFNDPDNPDIRTNQEFITIQTKYDILHEEVDDIPPINPSDKYTFEEATDKYATIKIYVDRLLDIEESLSKFIKKNSLDKFSDMEEDINKLSRITEALAEKMETDAIRLETQKKELEEQKDKLILELRKCQEDKQEQEHKLEELYERVRIIINRIKSSMDKITNDQHLPFKQQLNKQISDIKKALKLQPNQYTPSDFTRNNGTERINFTTENPRFRTLPRINQIRSSSNAPRNSGSFQTDRQPTQPPFISDMLNPSYQTNSVINAESSVAAATTDARTPRPTADPFVSRMFKPTNTVSALDRSRIRPITKQKSTTVSSSPQISSETADIYDPAHETAAVVAPIFPPAAASFPPVAETAPSNEVVNASKTELPDTDDSDIIGGYTYKNSNNKRKTIKTALGKGFYLKKTNKNKKKQNKTKKNKNKTKKNKSKRNKQTKHKK